jgi:hypothetical protein
MVPLAFFMGKMTMVIFAIKLIGLINLKIGMLLLIINVGILLAKLLALKKGHLHHGGDGQAHYYFNFSSPPAHHKPYYVKHSHPKNDFYEKLWDDIHHRSDQEHLESAVYSTQIPAPYYGSPPETVKYPQYHPYPQTYQQAYNHRQLLSVNENRYNQQDREFLRNRQNEKLGPTTTSHDISTILDEAMSKLKN